MLRMITICRQKAFEHHMAIKMPEYLLAILIYSRPGFERPTFLGWIPARMLPMRQLGGYLGKLFRSTRRQHMLKLKFIGLPNIQEKIMSCDSPQRFNCALHILKPPKSNSRGERIRSSCSTRSSSNAAQLSGRYRICGSFRYYLHLDEG